jgi:hypothetical protein
MARKSTGIWPHRRLRGFEGTGDGVSLSFGLEDLPGGCCVADRGLVVEAEDGGQV